MWSDSEDLVVISDMYQVKIKIITSKGISDKNPSVNWIFPDREMERFAELKNVKQNDMVLLHDHDSHFNLIISKDSELIKGSLSYRFNVGPLITKHEDETKTQKNVEEKEAEKEGCC